MNVCIVTPRYFPNSPGGGARSCHLIARTLNNIVNVEVISFDGKKTSSTEIDGVLVHRLKPTSSEKTSLNIQCFNYLRNKLGKFDLIHTYNMDLIPSIGLLTGKYKINSVATLNGTIYSRMNEWYYKFLDSKSGLKHNIFSISLLSRNVVLKEMIKKIRKFTALCKFRKESFIQEGLPGENISVIPNILDMDRKISSRNVKKGISRLLYFGTSRWRKGLDIIIDAYSLLRKQELELTIAGLSRPKEVEKSLNSERLKNKATVSGRVPYDDIGRLYAQSDILVHPLRFPEPVGRILIEGMQSELCVLATGTDYYSPIIRDMKDGLLLYPCTPNKLAKKIQFLLDNPELITRLAKSAKERVYDICNPEKIAKQYIELYEGFFA